MTTNVSGITNITQGNVAIFYEGITFHVCEISIRWMAKHCLMFPGGTCCHDAMFKKSLAGVLCDNDMPSYIYGSKNLSKRDGICHGRFIVEKAAVCLFEADCLVLELDSELLSLVVK